MAVDPGGAAPGRVPGAVRLGPLEAARCRRRIHLDHDPGADRSLRKPADPGMQLRLADLTEHRRRVRDRLMTTVALVDEWDPAGGDRPQAVWMPRLSTPTRFAVPDLLLRDDDGGYLPVLVRGHRTLDPGSGAICSHLTGPVRALTAPTASPDRKPRAHHADALALAHVYRILQELGLASRRARGGVIGRGGPATDPTWDDGALILWHELGASPAASGSPAAPAAAATASTAPAAAPSVLADYDARFADRLAVARAAATGQPALAQPSRIAECRRCPWWPVCEPQLQVAHDVSLLVAGADVDVLHAAGIVTYHDLAAMDPVAAAALPLTGIPAVEARARALAVIAGVPLVRRSERVDPRRADVELDVDMESYLDDGAYLWGTYLTGSVDRIAGLGDLALGYRPFVTWEPLDTPAAGQNFAAFWAYLTALRQACAAAGATFAAYCYSHTAEERWLYGTPQRFPDVPGMPDRRDVQEFCASPQWVDLYAEVKRCFVVPGSLRLKRVATVAGFAWRDPEPSGENSMVWYRIATGTPGGDAQPARSETGDGVNGNGSSNGNGNGGDGAGGADADPIESHRQRILRYNEDDVLATLALRRWMTDRSHEMPTVHDLQDRYRGGIRNAPSSRMTSPLR